MSARQEHSSTNSFEGFGNSSKRPNAVLFVWSVGLKATRQPHALFCDDSDDKLQRTTILGVIPRQLQSLTKPGRGARRGCTSVVSVGPYHTPSRHAQNVFALPTSVHNGVFLPLRVRRSKKTATHALQSQALQQQLLLGPPRLPKLIESEPEGRRQFHEDLFEDRSGGRPGS